MRGIKIPAGKISVYTSPLRIQGSAFRAYSEDLGITVFIPPKRLGKYFEKAFENWEGHFQEEKPYTPCVTNNSRTHKAPSYYNANLLIPPSITEKSELFVAGLVVPDLKLADVIGEDDNPKGYLLLSELLTSQKFYTPPKPILYSCPDIQYQGIIEEVYMGGKKFPRVWVTLNSNDSPDIFNQNSKKLEELLGSSANFWWKITN